MKAEGRRSARGGMQSEGRTFFTPSSPPRGTLHAGWSEIAASLAVDVAPVIDGRSNSRRTASADPPEWAPPVESRSLCDLFQPALDADHRFVPLISACSHAVPACCTKTALDARPFVEDVVAKFGL